MLTMLIVDDEKLFADSLRKEVEWASLGISSVHTAYNSRQAKDIYEREQVDFMLCDIEMPQGSGLELLAWVREHYPRTESVFMTCHADFRYAQRAVQLGSFDYLLKPVAAEELCQVVGRVVEKIKKDKETKQYSRFGEFWARHQPLLAERFWLDIINHMIPSHPELIRKEAEERNIPFDTGMKLLPVLISIQRYTKSFKPRDEKIIEYALINSGAELLGIQGSGLLFGLPERKLLALIPAEQDAPEIQEGLLERGQAFIDTASSYFYCDTAVYIGNEVLSHELTDMVSRLAEWDKNNVAHSNKVLLWRNKPYGQQAVALPDMNIWSVLLKEGQGDQVAAEAEMFLRSLSDSETLDADSLYRFHHNFLQMVYYVLKLNGIEAQLLFDDATSSALFRRAVRSLTDMIDWMKHTLSKAMDYAGTVQESQPILKDAENFILQALETGDLTREAVAHHVFLNPDYLDRLFKKETGHSITEFIVSRRMLLAQDLLAKTDLPVGTIASRTGYTNLAHFSRRFKQVVGMNPKDYRSNHKQ
ncbi:DNA-binding response regulator [Paenibacillus sp. PK3_47]|uniref:response regulator transcription factor n=1 Tax=Paenibacillus sp. PK3_47 TaxID=2072642 RepID=UPI00201DEBA6|nr:response regulator [Paenibacillus sp. PK3_47]UQZ35493.1 DNA-binding response regulator [Paenibacillus sp. PK3_47]